MLSLNSDLGGERGLADLILAMDSLGDTFTRAINFPDRSSPFKNSRLSELGSWGVGHVVESASCCSRLAYLRRPHQGPTIIPSTVANAPCLPRVHTPKATPRELSIGSRGRLPKASHLALAEGHQQHPSSIPTASQQHPQQHPNSIPLFLGFRQFSERKRFKVRKHILLLKYALQRNTIFNGMLLGCCCGCCWDAAGMLLGCCWQCVCVCKPAGGGGGHKTQDTI